MTISMASGGNLLSKSDRCPIFSSRPMVSATRPDAETISPSRIGESYRNPAGRGQRRDKAAIAEFFKQVAEHVKFSTFEPKEFVATDFGMVFTLRDGKVVHFQEFTDSAAVNAAYAIGAPV